MSDNFKALLVNQEDESFTRKVLSIDFTSRVKFSSSWLTTSALKLFDMLFPP